MTNWIKLAVGLGLIAFAIIPDPTDATVAIPIASFGAGIKLASDAVTEK